jgi:guanylate kinase
MVSSSSQPQLVIISGPSGVGKSTVVRQLLEQCPLPLRLSISATTRQPRPGEVDGVNYYFLSHEEFARRKELGDFLECKEVFGRGDWYGTLVQEVERGWQSGYWSVLEIDVEGAMMVVEKYPQAITVFLNVDSLQELERRLRDRGTENETAIERRLTVARHELEYLPKYKHEVFNHSIKQAVHDICDILHSYQNF